MNSSVTFCTVLVNVFIRGNGWHDNFFFKQRLLCFITVTVCTEIAVVLPQ